MPNDVINNKTINIINVIPSVSHYLIIKHEMISRIIALFSSETLLLLLVYSVIYDSNRLEINEIQIFHERNDFLGI